MYVEMDEYMSEAWRLDEVAELIKGGGVGIIPTDTKYAFVADLESRAAVQLLYHLKGAAVSKPMSILCRGFSDIDRYTMVGAARYCSPRHLTHFEPSLLELSGIL